MTRRFHHDQAGHAARPVRRRHAIILRDRPTAGDAAAIVHQRQTGFQNIAADIVEIDVDALGRRGPQRLEHSAVLVVDRGVEAEVARQPVALVLAAAMRRRAPLDLAICPTIDPTDPAAAETTTVSPAFGLPTSSSPK